MALQLDPLASAEALGAQIAAILHERPEGTALIVQTTGSTGEPKRVGLSVDALIASARATHGRLGGPGQWLLALPSHYVAGLQVWVRSLVAETEPVILPGAHFDAAEFVRAVERMTGARNYTSLVPVQLQRLVELAEGDPGSAEAIARLDAILVGGQRLDAALYDRAQRLGFSAIRTYGSSETSGGCVYDGLPLDGVILDFDDGEVLISGNILATEYVGNEHLTNERFIERDGERWYRTGDNGHIVDGALRVTGRRDRVIISGGLKISLDALERIAAEQGLVSAAIGIADETWGERPALFIEGTPNVEAETLLGLAIENELGAFALPRIQRVEVLPRGATGKVDPQVLRQRASNA